MSSKADRKRCSLVCRRLLRIEGQSRQQLSLNAQPDLHPLIPSIFFRFDAVTKLTLKCDRRSVGKRDEAPVLISERCRNLTCLTLRACLDLIEAAKDMNVVLDTCPPLEELSVKRLCGIIDGASTELDRARSGGGIVENNLLKGAL
ncbi:hypothetical protein J1N35_040928 [Gossypium stocksii]|uniref:Uncharacterized protein n=1 Tax=Gossypium stocksii TaxID=47602 RepID=A0A9D3UEW7_9ROSI|nr:hypothetical protein J1N35_040928 [Gossypium stocksii]